MFDIIYGRSLNTAATVSFYQYYKKYDCFKTIPFCQIRYMLLDPYADYRDSKSKYFFHSPCFAFDKCYSLQPQNQNLSFLYNKPLNFPRLQLQCANCGDTGYNLRSGRKKTRIFLKIMINYNHVKANVFRKRNARTFCQNMHQDFFECFCKLVLKCKV